MKIPFIQKPKPRHPLENYFKNKEKYSGYKDGSRPVGFKDKLLVEGPDAVIRAYPLEAEIDPYLAADIERDRQRRQKWAEEERLYLAAEEQSKLKRHGAKYGYSNSHWTHMKRCPHCHHDNKCKDTPGIYPCENVIYSKPCPGSFEVTLLDAARVRNTPAEHLVPFQSIGDRYDHDYWNQQNKARTKARKYAPHTESSSWATDYYSRQPSKRAHRT